MLRKGNHFEKKNHPNFVTHKGPFSSYETLLITQHKYFLSCFSSFQAIEVKYLQMLFA